MIRRTEIWDPRQKNIMRKSVANPDRGGSTPLEQRLELGCTNVVEQIYKALSTPRNQARPSTPCFDKPLGLEETSCEVRGRRPGSYSHPPQAYPKPGRKLQGWSQPSGFDCGSCGRSKLFAERVPLIPSTLQVSHTCLLVLFSTSTTPVPDWAKEAQATCAKSSPR